MKSSIWIKFVFLALTLCLFTGQNTQAQIQNLSFDSITLFSKHLIENELHRENIIILNQKTGSDTSLTLSRLKAYSYFKSGKTDSALITLNEFQNPETELLSLYIRTKENIYTDTFYCECNPVLYPHCFDVLKVSLLKNRRFDKYGEWFYEKDIGSLNFDNQFGEYLSVKRKSGFLAAAMSAVIPGTGKMYAGKTGEGVGALITNLILGWQFYDHYNLLGISSVRTIAYGALFSTFYLGNIYGSAISVRVLKNQQYEILDNSIMLDVSVPFERLFTR